jgi:hypothetical protein
MTRGKRARETFNETMTKMTRIAMLITPPFS